jgi:hypothetical protein
VVAEVRLGRKNGALGIFDRSGVARKDLDPARGASSIAAAPVKDVDTRILDHKDELLPVFGFNVNFAVRSFRSDHPHQEISG